MSQVELSTNTKNQSWYFMNFYLWLKNKPNSVIYHMFTKNWCSKALRGNKSTVYVGKIPWRAKFCNFYTLTGEIDYAGSKNTPIKTYFEGLKSQEIVPIYRLNSGILMIFKIRVWNLALNGSDCRTSKNISNDTKLEPISWDLDVGNPFSTFAWVFG